MCGKNSREIFPVQFLSAVGKVWILNAVLGAHLSFLALSRGVTLHPAWEVWSELGSFKNGTLHEKGGKRESQIRLFLPLSYALALRRPPSGCTCTLYLLCWVRHSYRRCRTLIYHYSPSFIFSIYLRLRTFSFLSSRTLLYFSRIRVHELRTRYFRCRTPWWCWITILRYIFFGAPLWQQQIPGPNCSCTLCEGWMLQILTESVLSL